MDKQEQYNEVNGLAALLTPLLASPFTAFTLYGGASSGGILMLALLHITIFTGLAETGYQQRNIFPQGAVRQGLKIVLSKK